MGKKYHIGVRGLDISKFEIEVESDRAIEHKIPYVREIKFENGLLKLDLDVGPAGPWVNLRLRTAYLTG